MTKKNGGMRRLCTAIMPIIVWFHVVSSVSAAWPNRERQLFSSQLAPSLEFTIPSLEDLTGPPSPPPPPPPPRPSIPSLLWPRQQQQQQKSLDEDEDFEDENEEVRPSAPSDKFQESESVEVKDQSKESAAVNSDAPVDKESAIDRRKAALLSLPRRQGWLDQQVWPWQQQQQKPSDVDEDEAEEVRSSAPSEKPQESEAQKMKKEIKESVAVNMNSNSNQSMDINSAGDRRKTALLSFPRRQGRVDVEVQGLHSPRNRRSAPRIHGKSDRTSPPDRSPAIDPDAVTASVDPAAVFRLIWLCSQGTGSAGLAMLGTLRLLAPLIVARRGLNWIGDIFSDWYTGRYLRKTYYRMEHNYWRFYQVPAVLRSAGRLAAQLTLLMTLGKVMESWVGLSHSPCLDGSGGCYWWCGILWIVAVVGTGHAGAAAIAIWGGPLAIQLPIDSMAQRRPSKRQVIRNPWHILQWLRDPDQWISEFASSRRDSAAQLKPFHPDPLIFPVTYEPLRILQMVTIAKEMALNKSMMHSIMRQVLIQQAMGDEWFRVLLLERRVTLGIVVMVGYIWSTFSLFWTAARASYLSALLLLPSLLA
jgi:hypothetical protein